MQFCRILLASKPAVEIFSNLAQLYEKTWWHLWFGDLLQIILVFEQPTNNLQFKRIIMVRHFPLLINIFKGFEKKYLLSPT